MCQLLTNEDRRNHHNQPCTFCGNDRPTAVWRGAKGFVHCCTTCALEVLPALMADATAKRGAGFVNMQGFKTIEKNFWKALYLTTCSIKG